MTVIEVIRKRGELVKKINAARRSVLIANAGLRNEIEAYCDNDTNFDRERILDAQAEYDEAIAELFDLKDELEMLDEMEVKED